MTVRPMLLVVLLSVGLLGGCGNKGPLFLPAPAAESPQGQASGS